MITLHNPINVPVQSTQSISVVTVERYVDFPKQRIVKAYISETSEPIILWSGESYVSIGDWTENQAKNRIKDIVDTDDYKGKIIKNRRII